MASNNLIAARELMVNSQLIRRGIRAETVLEAMRTIPRHAFVAKHQWPFAYDDYPLPIGHKQTISQPYIVAYMTEQLQVMSESRVLEIGTGCGYQTAILAELAREVISLEIVPELAESSQKLLNQMGYKNITIHHTDGRKGWPAQAPYDRIITTAAATSIPSELVAQLAPGGRMIIPVGTNTFNQKLELVSKDQAGQVQQIPLLAVRFVPLV